MPSRGQPVYPLSVASRLVGLSPRTLRVYEEADLIAPARIGGKDQRMYSEQDLQWLRCIRDMIHDEGLTVTAIRRLLDLIPCWEVRHCSPSVALECAPCQNVPRMGRGAVEPAMPNQPAPPVVDNHGAAPTEPPVTITLVYGVEELGSVLECMRCISAERNARRVALRYPGQVRVQKVDLLDPRAARFGAVLPPMVAVNDEVISAGKGIAEEPLARAVDRYLSIA